MGVLLVALAIDLGLLAVGVQHGAHQVGLASVLRLTDLSLSIGGNGHHLHVGLLLLLLVVVLRILIVIIVVHGHLHLEIVELVLAGVLHATHLLLHDWVHVYIIIHRSVISSIGVVPLLFSR